MNPFFTRRRIRLGAGALMWVYIASHLANHALGLVSLAAAEQGLKLAVAVWHSLPGTVLLYSAFVLHVSLALNGLYHRHIMSQPPSELLRIAFGLSIPLLLIGHAVSTRLAWELYGLAPQYERVVQNLVNSGAQGQQIALLAPGWLHGCMGLHVALRHRAWFQRWRWVLVVAVAALPVLAAAGFMSMTTQLAALGFKLPPPGAEQMQSLSGWRDGILYAYLSMIGVLLLAMLVRHRRAP
jgi:adenylate cyclase